MTQEYINRAWLAQNVRLDMTAAQVANVIENAPFVEFDPDEPPQHGRCERCGYLLGNICRYWTGFTMEDDWCSHFQRREEA